MGNGSCFWPLADEEDSDEEIAEAENAASMLSLYVAGAKLQETTVEDHASDRQGIARSPRVVSNPPRASGRESRPLVRIGKRRSSLKISLGDILVNDVCLVREGEERWRLAQFVDDDEAGDMNVGEAPVIEKAVELLVTEKEGNLQFQTAEIPQLHGSIVWAGYS